MRSIWTSENAKGIKKREKGIKCIHAKMEDHDGVVDYLVYSSKATLP